MGNSWHNSAGLFRRNYSKGEARSCLKRFCLWHHIDNLVMEKFCADHECDILYTPPPGEGTADKMRVDFSARFNRKVLPELEHLIEQNWLKLKSELQDKLYNDDKFRIHSVREMQNKEVVIEVGLTNYKEYVGTNLGGDLEVFLERGIKDYGSEKAYLSDALGVGSVVLTADNFLLLVQRSYEVAEGQGLTDFPGGHAEPKEITSKIKDEACDIFSVKGKDVVHEFFYSMVREVRDEINLPEDSLSWPILLGLLRNCRNGGKPHASFLIKCSLGKDQIKAYFEKGGPEAYESTGILFFSEEELLKKSVLELKKEFGELTPCAKATLYLYFCKFRK